MGITIGIVNQKGGAGKTTTTVEMAINFAHFDKRVLLIDADSQSSIAKCLPVDENHLSLYEVLHGQCTIDEAIQHVNGFDVIIAKPELSKADREFVDYDDVFLLKDITDILRDKYEYILVDTGPARSIILSMVYAAADYIISPCNHDILNVVGVAKVCEDLYEFRASKRPISNSRLLAILQTDYYEGRVSDEDVKTQLANIAQQMAEDNPINTQIITDTTASKCKGFKLTIGQYDKHSRAAIQYRDFVYDIIERLEA